MKPINVLRATCTIKKTGTLAMTLYIQVGETIPYVRFGYVPMTIYNHTRGKVSRSTNVDPINTMTGSRPRRPLFLQAVSFE